MENVVYFLGAGFSAPLGLPVISNFYQKSKDMYFDDPERYKHFKEVIGIIQNMSAVKNYFTTDLYNIEEIMSILEMSYYLRDRRRLVFKKYIADVISHFTPPIKDPPKPIPANYENFIFGDSFHMTYYGYFVASIFNLILRREEIRDDGPQRRFIDWQCIFRRADDQDTSYSIISLNYDLVLESMLDFIKSKHTVESNIRFYDPLIKKSGELNPLEEIPLAKLHGSIKPLSVVPPTWNKTSNKELKKAWKLAYSCLRNANQIRILGYSLPIADSYIKYLLKSAILDAKNLKYVDIICLDPNSDVKKRYDEFIEFKYCFFKNEDISIYLDRIHSQAKKEKAGMRFDELERAHSAFWGRY